ncbi:interleukin-1 receptor-associated kinase 4-like [Babylonia areolata]|uniref:interleukin-1 receptor-associated kinase 4-like n=1 Tax=Babylonia areolata TaxID=304850 RepID=UPI003FD20E3F
MVVLTLESFIRHMPHRAFVKLSTLLDPGGLWEKMAAAIPLRLEETDDENAEKRYTHQQIAVFALMGQRAGVGSSPTQKVLMDWATKNARIHHLITILTHTEFFTAADYLHNDLLQLGPVPRPASEVLDMPDDRPSNDPAQTVMPNTCLDHLKETDIVQQPCQKKEEEVAPWCGGLSEMSEELNTISENMSYYSSARESVMNQAGLVLSHLERQTSVAEEDKEEAWIGLTDIEIQTIPYAMLGGVTNNFNDDPLEKGGNLIGSGGFGMVYLGKFHNGFKVAVKYLKQTGQMKQEDLIKQFENEVKTLSTYRHHNVVHLLGYSIDGPSQCLVYQYLPNGSLEDRLARLQGTPPLSANMRLKIVKGTASGIQYLNDSGYVHRDIKSANILLDSEFTAKVGDFATVVSAPSGDSKTIAMASVVIGTPAYLAPEAMSFDVSTKLDCYSFGVVLLEVITGLAAQDSQREEVTLTSHIMENVEDPAEIHDYVDQSAGTWADGIIDKLYDISMRCLTHLKKRRPNVKAIRPELEAL